jgi:cell division protein FtsA
MDSRYIVALEIGSSKITGAVAKVEPETSDIKVLAVDTMPLTNSVRYGRVQNVQEVSTTINDIIRKLENHPTVTPRHVSQVFIALGGRSFATVSATGTLQMPTENEITLETIERLKREASFDIVTGKELVSIEPRKFFVANTEVKNVVGTFGKNLRGEFTAIICSPDNRRNLERVKISSIDTPARHYIPRPVAIADMVLTPSEKQVGCAMIDFGAETTTITIYKDGKLQFISTVPLGGRNITLDLMTAMSLTEERAELVKRTLGTAVSDRNNPVPNPNQPEIDNYVQARTGEIVANALNQLTVAGFKVTDLPAGLIIVGGATKLKDFNRLLEAQSKMKVHFGDIDNAVKMLDGKRSAVDFVDVISILRYAARTTTVNCLEGENPEIQDRLEHFGADARDLNNPNHRDYVPGEDDEDLLLDDDEVAERRKNGQPQNEPQPKSKFHLFKKHKPEPEPEYVEEDDDGFLDDEDDSDDIGYEDEEEDDVIENKPQVNKENRSRWMKSITNMGKRIFGTLEDE